ncbi:MAG: TlpA family protein disulfide reductase [Bacteroidetes bacterium]|nr:MAG: TlpA family protein disulfide reductase [Bacteroidota bacterium]
MHKRLTHFCLCLLLATAASAQQVREWKMPDLESRLAGAGDTLLIVNFWATWCRPCVEEIPHFEAINQKYAAQGVKVLFVSLDFPSQKKTVSKFIASRNMQAETVLLAETDYDAWMPKISPDWGGAIPATLIVRPAKGVRDFAGKSFTYAELETWVLELLQEAGK